MEILTQELPQIKLLDPTPVLNSGANCSRMPNILPDNVPSENKSLLNASIDSQLAIDNGQTDVTIVDVDAAIYEHSEAIRGLVIQIGQHSKIIADLARYRSEPAPFNLNSRELEFISLLKQGLTTREIAKRYKVTEKSFRQYLYLIYKKVSVNNKEELLEKL